MSRDIEEVQHTSYSVSLLAALGYTVKLDYKAKNRMNDKFLITHYNEKSLWKNGYKRIDRKGFPKFISQKHDIVFKNIS